VGDGGSSTLFKDVVLERIAPSRSVLHQFGKNTRLIRCFLTHHSQALAIIVMVKWRCEPSF
jgi:hypothetical protein